MSVKVEMNSERLLLRELTEDDVTDRYLGWLRDGDAMKFITAASRTKGMQDLKEYVCQRIGRDDVLFLGIFDKESGLHIGNIKYEPVDPAEGYAVMGILIGDPGCRGKGVGTDALVTSAKWLKEHRGIRQIVLGVYEDNVAGVKSYEKAGFVVADTPYIEKYAPGQITMVWNL